MYRSAAKSVVISGHRWRCFGHLIRHHIPRRHFISYPPSSLYAALIISHYFYFHFYHFNAISIPNYAILYFNLQKIYYYFEDNDAFLTVSENGFKKLHRVSVTFQRNRKVLFYLQVDISLASVENENDTFLVRDHYAWASNL